MSSSLFNARSTPPTRPASRQAWVSLVLLAVGLLLAAWAHAVPARQALAEELRACQHRLVVGYTTSGIRISEDDRRTIVEACDRAVHERRQGQP